MLPLMGKKYLGFPAFWRLVPQSKPRIVRRVASLSEPKDSIPNTPLGKRIGLFGCDIGVDHDLHQFVKTSFRHPAQFLARLGGVTD